MNIVPEKLGPSNASETNSTEGSAASIRLTLIVYTPPWLETKVEVAGLYSPFKSYSTV
ncbi:hypothetical protein ABNB59_21755 [Paenibacillus larvae]|uniref:Uncharacterized protein n=1 Tax=Paenibacillus larvae TaxID=1464 RepID=A0AAP5JQP4_9BACL|nr:hypothetical protein [Paenibacillus larvae]MCY7492110.1 hypothetical protein [Paenibacillus larvae]MCY9523876.1 hypothetical protein [Paenibacillus larvae]MCY9565082.1 hypothetical protein [Paenibacillus larvae]MCY9569951.1 hypothetical protein [Paenibacillus larvae]MCY9690246.1 hypothetical protein [Paenibacillus larvae]